MIELGKYYGTSSYRKIKSLETLKYDISDLKHLSFRRFSEEIYICSSDEKWQLKRAKESKTLLSKYSLDELVNILKGMIIYELFSDVGRGSTTLSIPIYFEIAAKDYEKAQELQEWAELFAFDNSYFPYGEMSKISFYQYVYKYSQEPTIVKKLKVKLQVAGYIKFNV